MRVVYYYAPKPRERLLGDALAAGCKAFGDDFTMIHNADFTEPQPDKYDIAIAFGVKSAHILKPIARTEMSWIIIDKGYTRMKAPGTRVDLYYRASVNAFQPLDYFQLKPRPSDRWNRLKIDFQPFDFNRRGHVIFAGASAKYMAWHEWDAQGYAERMCRKIRKHMAPPREIVYRPKPSWSDATPIERTTWSGPDQSIHDVLGDARCLVTFGSNAAVDALVSGVPVFVLGDGIAKPMGREDVEVLDEPLIPNKRDLYQWACDMAYCQWTREEFASGEAWGHLRKLVIERG